MPFYDVTNPDNFRYNPIPYPTIPNPVGVTIVPVADPNHTMDDSMPLNDFNTIHYFYSTTGTTSFDILTQMLENAVYEVRIDCNNSAGTNDDFTLRPNFTTASFYNIYQYTTSAAGPVFGIAGTTSNSSAISVDMLGGAYGREPVGVLQIYNIRNAKKTTFDLGDSACFKATGQSYWTTTTYSQGASSSTPMPYDTTTQWLEVGTLSFNVITNWNVWVRRIA